MSETISNKPYDDTFKSILVHCRQVVVPLVNEVFKTNYGLQEEVKFRNTELYNLKGDTERDVDTTFTIGDTQKLYHLECESSAEDIIVRMFEYDTMMALQSYKIEKGKLRAKFPSSAVLYLRSTNNTPSRFEIVIEVEDKEFSYSIPVIKVSDYSINDIFAKKLYFLLPFQFFVYEKDLKDYNSGKRDINDLLLDFNVWVELLEAVDEKEIASEVKTNLYNYAMNVALALSSKYKAVYKEVDRYMGGRVLLDPFTRFELEKEKLTADLDGIKAELADKTAELADKDAKLADKTAELADKDAELADKDAELADKTAELADKTAELADKDAELATLRAEIERLKAEKSA